jgi:hypothetical protein
MLAAARQEAGRLANEVGAALESVLPLWVRAVARLKRLEEHSRAIIRLTRGQTLVDQVIAGRVSPAGERAGLPSADEPQPLPSAPISMHADVFAPADKLTPAAPENGESLILNPGATVAIREPRPRAG